MKLRTPTPAEWTLAAPMPLTAPMTLLALLAILALSSAGSWAAPLGYGPLPSASACHENQLGDNHLATLPELTGCTSAAQTPSSRILRGGYLLAEDAADCLQSQGVQTIISLQMPYETPGPQAEGAWAKKRGINYYFVPVTADLDEVPSECKAAHLDSLACNHRQMARVQKIVADELTRTARTGGKVYIHCTHGQDRTGLAVALLRTQVQGCSREAARAEMLDFGFHPAYPALERVWQSP